jgi:subtilisin-like proprotein convertase family protein
MIRSLAIRSLAIAAVLLLGVAGASAGSITDTFTATPNLVIPDAPSGELGPEVSTTMDIALPRYISDIEIYFALDHNSSSDLRMWVESPYETKIMLFFIGEGGEPNVDPAGWYDTDFTPKESMDPWIGEGMSGTWTMIWQDLSNGETGTLTEWRIKVTYDDAIATEETDWTDIKALYR